MNEHQKAEGAHSLTLSDAMYVIFRHKWKIALISSLGLVAVMVVRSVMPHMYQSEALLLVKYVQQSKSPDQVMNSDPTVKPTDVGEGVINTELQILTSLDLAKEVAAAIGPEKLLPKEALNPKRHADANVEFNPLLAAARVVKDGLSAELPKHSPVIRVVFQHREKSMVQPVLAKILDLYLKQHAMIHGEAGAIDSFLKKETEELGSELKKTEEELIAAKNNAGISSLEDDKKLYAQQIARIRDEIFDAEAELAERKTLAEALAKSFSTKPIARTNAVAMTNEVVVPPEIAADYKRVCRLLDYLNRKADEYELIYTPSNSLVREVRERIATNERLKKKLEDDTPLLLSAKVSESRPDLMAGTRTDPLTEKARIAALEAKLKKLNDQQDVLRREAEKVNRAEAPIKELQIKKELEETHYRIMSANLGQSRIAEALSAGRVWGIKPIQEPSPPISAQSKRYKFMAIALFGPIAAAFGLAFLIELYIDQTVRRPVEVETKLRLPLFLSIPRLKLNGSHPASSEPRARPLLAERTDSTAAKDSTVEAGSPDEPAEAQLAAWDPRNILRPFHEALRDRLITHFELKNLTRKPKLVAVTSCAEGSGVSTVAAGLAASLSETGEGNVLLVDMNQQNGAAHHFYHGDLACDLDDALEKEKRENALVQENLYVVMEGADGELPRVLPKRFNTLVPRLKASDYDYIIFDMPPVSQISITPRVAKFMDMVLMVVESEKTDRNVVQRASSLLGETKTDVGIVLNKGRTYVPKRLQQEL